MSTTISLSPNTQADDVWTAFCALFAPWRWSDKHVINKILSLISKRLANRPAVLVSSGRTAIYRTLEALDIGPGDEVIIQAFTCLAVPAPILWRQATPVFADIDLATYNFNISDVVKKITPRTRAIIVQHTFGIAGPIKKLRQLADQHHLTLIEDLSHAFGASYQEQALGTFGHVAVLSFGRDKTISCVYGGAVVSNDAKIIKRVAAVQDSLPKAPAWWVIQQLLHPLLMALIVPLYFWGGVGKVLLVTAQKMHLLSMAVSKNEKLGGQPAFLQWQFSPALGILLHHQLHKLSRYTTRRQKIARQYATHLPATSQLSPLNQPNYLRYPLRVKNRTKLLKHAQKNHLLLGNWYDHPVTPTSPKAPLFSGYVPNSCPQAELAAATTINLPTHPNLTDHQIAEIIDVLSKARWARV